MNGKTSGRRSTGPTVFHRTHDTTTTVIQAMNDHEPM